MSTDASPLEDPSISTFGWKDNGRLILLGAAVLFWELVLIRWLGASIRVVAYYSNAILTAAFLGLGAGSLLQRFRRLQLAWLTTPALSLAAIVGSALGGVHHENLASTQEYVWSGGLPGMAVAPEASPLGVVLPPTLILGITFLTTLLAFVCLGWSVGDAFARRPGLRAYTLEVAGGILGLLAFAMLSLAHTTPVVWFAVGYLLLLPLVGTERKHLLIYATCAVMVVASAAAPSSVYRWSPYYKIRVSPVRTFAWDLEGPVVTASRPIGYSLEVNNDYHQMLLDLAPHGEEPPRLRAWRELYETPYDHDAELPPGRVLIVGAGTGNDVTAALRRTHREIDAVEVDPVILQLGRQLNRERPYSNPRVHVHNQDARQFFEQTHERYAIVVFGFLDSHTLMSSFTSLRLDNFVYTRESLERVRGLLVPGGQVFLAFAITRDWLGARLRYMLDDVFGPGTQVIERWAGYHNGAVFTNGLHAGSPPPASPAHDVRVTTDDWPFLYLAAPGLPSHYAGFVVLLLLGAAASLRLLPRGRRTLRLPFAFMGAAFFLLETSSVVTLALVFGSTWYVNVSVFTGVPALVTAGNLTAMRWRPRFSLAWLGVPLCASVLLAWFVPVSAMLGIDNVVLRSVLTVVVFLGPVYFASILFAFGIRDEPELSAVYGSNLLGAVVGAAAEYASLAVGFKALLLGTFALYLLATLGFARGRGAPSSIAAAP